MAAPAWPAPAAPLPPPLLELERRTYHRGDSLPIPQPVKILESGAAAVRRWDVAYRAARAPAGTPATFRLVWIQGSGTGRSGKLQLNSLINLATRAERDSPPATGIPHVQ